ncbi:uracil-DNA glycosylase [Acetobacter oeni]|nr:uracil-DNA glycosylase [Acetobacter oeni]MBB3882349.1 DNA polymerase [Acetobacter oeni]
MDTETARTLLRLQIEWGVDVDLDDVPHDRFAESAAEMARRAAASREALQAGGGASERDASGSAGLSDVGRYAERPGDGGGFREAERAGSGRSGAGRPAVPVVADLSGISTPEALAQATEAFEGCVLRGTATHSVLPRGPVGARVMVIGDAPDEDEDRSGVPFSGLAGSLLDKMLTSIRLDREQLVLAAAVPWRPPGGRAPSPAEVAACLPLLLKSIAVYRPERLLLCGGLATRMILGAASTETTAGLSVNPARLRGAWRETEWGEEWGPRRPALAIRHPLQLRASAAARREIWNDLLLLAVTLDGLNGSGT